MGKLKVNSSVQERQFNEVNGKPLNPMIFTFIVPLGWFSYPNLSRLWTGLDRKLFEKYQIRKIFKFQHPVFFIPASVSSTPEDTLKI